MLVSRDDSSCLVVSYREIKTCVEAAYSWVPSPWRYHGSTEGKSWWIVNWKDQGDNPDSDILVVAKSHEEADAAEMKRTRMSGPEVREGEKRQTVEEETKIGKPKNSRKIRSKPLSHASYFFTIPNECILPSRLVDHNARETQDEMGWRFPFTDSIGGNMYLPRFQEDYESWYWLIAWASSPRWSSSLSRVQVRSSRWTDDSLAWKGIRCRRC